MAMERYEVDRGQYLKHGKEFEAGVLLSLGVHEYPEGLVLGRITATGQWAPYVLGATNGTQKPGGVLNQAVSSGAIGTFSVGVLIVGDVRDDKTLVWSGGTPVPMSPVERDALRAAGVVAIKISDNGEFDN
jgi:hypothetical protein